MQKLDWNFCAGVCHHSEKIVQILEWTFYSALVEMLIGALVGSSPAQRSTTELKHARYRDYATTEQGWRTHSPAPSNPEGSGPSRSRHEEASHTLRVPRLEPHPFGVGDSDLLKWATAFKIYTSSLEPVRISTAGDRNFFAAQKAWRRLIQDFPVQKKYERRLLASAFSGTALSVFEGIASSNLHCETEELWDLARNRL